MDVLYYLYKVTNKVNGKCYIGYTCDFKRRIGQHRRMNGNLKLFYSDISLFGVDNFSFEWIASCRNKEDAKKGEIELIKQWNSRHPNGYNITPGGDYSISHSKETISKIIKANKEYLKNNIHPMKGRRHSSESKLKMSKSAKLRSDRPKGKNHWNYGKIIPDNVKCKMGLKRGKNSNARRVVDLKLNKVFDCIQDACDFYNVSHSIISMICSGKRKPTKRLNFKYHDEK